MLRSVLALSLLLTAACQSPDKAPPKDGPAPTSADAQPDTAPDPTPSDPPPAASQDVKPLLAQLGDGAPMAFVLRPSRWSELRAAAGSIVGDLKLPGASALLEAKDPSALLQLGLAPVGVDASKLAGLDLERPIVGGVGEPADLEPFAVPDPGTTPGTYVSTGFRHVVFVPVSDAKAFIDALPGALGRFEALEPFDGTMWTGHDGGERFVTASPEGAYVRLVIFTNVRNLTKDEARTQLTERTKVTTSTLEETPALQEVVGEETPMAVHLRPWRFRSFVSATGRDALTGALASVDPSMRSLMLAKGLSLVLLADMLMNDAGAEVDDWGLTLRVTKDQVSVGAVASLTPTGRALFEAAATELKPLAVGGAPVAQGFVRLDTDRAMAKIELPESLTGARPSEVAMRFAECGPGCATHAGTRTPMRSLKLLLFGAELPKKGELPMQVLQVALTGFEPPRGSAALRVDSADAGAARTWLEGVGAPPLEEAAGAEVVTFSIHEGAKATFGAEVETESMVEASLRVEGLQTQIGDVRLGFRLRHEGPALVAELGARRGADPTLDYAPKMDGLSWSSPIESFEGAATSDCVTEIAMGYSKVFGALATVAPDMRAKVLEKGLEEVEAAATCLDSIPLDKARLERLSGFMNSMVATPVGNVPTSTTTTPRRLGTTIVVEPSSLTYDGESIDIEAEDHFNEPLRDRAEKGAEMAKLTASSLGQAFDGLVVIEIDPKVPFVRVHDVLWSVWQAGWPNFELAVAAKDGTAAGIPIVVPKRWLGTGDKDDGIPKIVLRKASLVVTEPGVKDKKTFKDIAALGAWAQTYAAGGEERSKVLVQIDDDVPMQRVVDALDALRGKDCELSGPKGCLLHQPILDGEP